MKRAAPLPKSESQFSVDVPVQQQDGPRRSSQPPRHGRTPLSTHLKRFFLAFALGVLFFYIVFLRLSMGGDSGRDAFSYRSAENGHKVGVHRPVFRNVERYSPKHRFRPAASPIVTQKDFRGRTKVKGDYIL